MPRPVRIEFAGATYHVMSRGNYGQGIFKDDKDRAAFVQLLGETCEKSGWLIHSFVLMGNHYHLLVETVRATLVRGMHDLNSTYTHRHNARHKVWGHLFQGRYKPLLVQPGSGYFLAVSNYIHMNPVRAGRVNEMNGLLKDRGSSAGWLAGAQKSRPAWLRWERVFGELGLERWNARGRKEFRQSLGRSLREKMGAEELKPMRRGWCYGAEEYVEQMKQKLADLVSGEQKPEKWSWEPLEELEEKRAGELMEGAARKLGWKSLGDVKGMDRYVIGHLARTQTQVTVGWLAQSLGVRTRGGMGNGIWRVRQMLQTDKRLQKSWKVVCDNK
jgi:REP element-mobilizing transposase RayT